MAEQQGNPKQRDPMEQAALALYFHVAQMVKDGKSRDEIERHLIHDKGVKPSTAKIMLDKLDESRANVARRSGYRNALIGGLVVVAALLSIFGVFSGERATGMLLVTGVAILLCGGFIGVRGVMQITGL